MSLQSLTPGDLSAWDDLVARAAEPNPFFEAEFVIPAADTLEVAAPKLLIQTLDGVWVACCPVRVTRALGLPMALSTWKHPYSYMGTPLVDGGHLPEFAESLAKYLELWRNGRFLLLRRATDGAVVEAIRSSARRSGSLCVLMEHTEERAAIRRRPNPDDYLAGLKPRRRKEIEKRRHRLANALDGEPVVTDRSEDPSAIEAFLQLEASGWKGSAGTAMATSGDADLFRSICERFGKQGRLQLLALECQERPVAMQCNLSADGTLFNFKVAFDEQFRRHAPGIQLEIDAIRIFHEMRGEQLFDSCASQDNELLNRLWPDRRSITTLAIGPDGFSGRMIGRALDAARRAKVSKSPSE